jgi:acyl-CoA synthetase (AMP-forming)/AMP-acid ligase II
MTRYPGLPESVPEALRRAARDHATRGVGIFDGRGRNVDRRTWAGLYVVANAIAARIAHLGIGPGEPVIIAHPTSWEWMEAWFGVMARGALPVASSGAGAMAAAEQQLDKVDKVMARIGARWVLASDGFKHQAVDGGYSWAPDRVVTPSELASVTPDPGFSAPSVGPDDVAFLQLTSGSTGLPRAVMITHLGAVHNPVASSEAIGTPMGAPAHEWADAMVSWLPLYHDMGLIGCLMLPMLHGLDTWLFRPTTFLARPRLWLEQLAAHGQTFCPSPNFGYQLCVERVRPQELEGLDLSGWRAALTGAEMVRPETCTAFAEKFAGFGFRPEAFQPCYGLAEGTLAVSFDQRGEGVRTLPAPSGTDAGFQLSDVVSTGEAVADTEIRILSPGGRPLAENAIGEVAIKGPGVFKGYFADPQATAETLVDGWFRTGDLGFLHDRELYLTGRTKDVLIVHGHNLMPDDLERIADSVTGGGGLARSAAFSVAHGGDGEVAVMVVEVSDPDPAALPALEREIRVRVGREIGLPLSDVVFVRRGRIPRTTSGKMQRHELRQRYLDRELEAL